MVLNLGFLLLNEAGEACGVKVRTRYVYRWGYVKIHREFVADGPVEARNLWVLSTVLDPSRLPYPLARLAAAELLDGGKTMSLAPELLSSAGLEIAVPADRAVLLHLR